MPHVRIERADDEGSKRITGNDRIVAVGDDGLEVDISSAVRGWNVSSRAGEAESTTLYVLGVRVIENPTLLPVPEPELPPLAGSPY